MTEQKVYTCQMCGEKFLDPSEGKLLVVFGIGLIVHRTCLEDSND